MNKLAFFITAALSTSAAADNCSPVSVLVETEQVSLSKNVGTAFITFEDKVFRGRLVGNVVSFDPNTGLPIEIRYRFSQGTKAMVFTGYPIPESFTPLTFDNKGKPIKALLDIVTEYKSGKLGSITPKSLDIVVSGVFDQQTKQETFLSNKTGVLCQ
jgi:hypothetical protein